MATTSEEAGRAVGEIASAVGEVAQGAERQVRAVEQAKVATEEVASASGVSAQNAQETAEAAVTAGHVAEQGAQAVAKASDAMGAVRDNSVHATAAIRELGAKSEQIEGIVATITGIAEQTNLLALNAAIEAAARPASRAAGSRWWPRRCASWPRSRRRRPVDRRADRRDPGRDGPGGRGGRGRRARTEDGVATVEQARRRSSRWARRSRT